MTLLIGIPDVSYYQKKVDDSFTRHWLIFRVCDGDFRDPNAAHNLAWAIKARAAGKIINFTVYVVYRPGKNASILATLKWLGVPSDCVVMIDVESWGGKIRGNHSYEINSLATSLRARQHGRADLVWAYANRGDFANVFPTRSKTQDLIVAGYSSIKPSNPGPGPMVGWQYTDGETRWPVPNGYPRSSEPFGHCDHNVLYATPKPTTAVVVKPAPKPTPKPVIVAPEAEMLLYYVRVGKIFSVWEKGPGVYRHVPNATALAPLKRAGVKAVIISTAEHAAALAAAK